jgi:hypothetical protein
LANPLKLRKYLRRTPERVHHFEEELAALDATIGAPPKREVAPRPPRPDLIDEEHATPSERRDAREAANRPSWLSMVPTSWIVCSDGAFVAVRFEQPF